MITALEQVTEGRLCWPENKPRSAQRRGSPFRTEVTKAVREVDWEMGRFRVVAHVLSRNNQRIFAGDPGAALWWLDRKRRLRVLACDRYTKLSDNIHAIALTLGAMRALERWGAYTLEQAAEGARPALPPPDYLEWWTVLGVERAWPVAAIDGVYRDLAKKHHADTAAMQRLNAAVEAARKEKSSA